LQVIYVIQNGLPFFSFFVSSNRFGLSCSSFWHTHIIKGIIAYVLSLFHIYRTTTVDSGGAYLTAFPHFVFLIGVIILAFLLVAAFFYFATSFQKQLSSQSLRAQICLLLGYAIASFSLIKGAVDGGLGIGCLLIVGFVALFILKEKKGTLSYNVYLGLLLGAIIMTLAGWLLNFYPSYFFNHELIGQNGALVALGTTLLYGTEKKANHFFLILLFLAFIACDWPIQKLYFNFYQQYGGIHLVSGTVVYTSDYGYCGLEKIMVSKPLTLAQLTYQSQRNLYYQPFTIPGITCQENQIKQSLKAVLITDRYFLPDSFTSSPQFFINNDESIWKDGHWQTSLTINLGSCLPQPAIAIDNSLKNKGLDHYILVLPNNYVTTNTD